MQKFSMRRARRRNARIVQYVRECCQGLDMAATERRVRRRFPGVSNWYYLKSKLSTVVSPQNEPLAPSVENTCQPLEYQPQVAIPENISPEAKTAISQLIAVNCQQECRIQTQAVENAALRDSVGRSDSRVRVLKAMLGQVLAAM